MPRLSRSDPYARFSHGYLDVPCGAASPENCATAILACEAPIRWPVEAR